MSVQVKGSGTIGGLDEGLVISGIVTSSTQINVGSNIKLGSAGIVTAANFKTGVTNLHSTGLTLTGGQLDVGSNIKIGTAGVVTATSFVGSGANLTSLPSQLTLSNNADNRVITGGSGTNLNGEANLTFNGFGLGINDSSGNARLVVSGDSDNGDQHCQIRIYDTDTTSGSQIPSVSFWGGSTEIGRIRGTDTQGLRFYTADSGTLTEKVSIDSSGRLHIASGGSTTNVSGNADDIVIGNTSTSNETGITFFSTSATSLRFNDAAGTDGAIEYGHTPRSLTFSSANANKMRITQVSGGSQPKVSIGALANSAYLNTSTNGDRSTVKIGNYLHLDSGGNGNFTGGMYYNCWPNGQAYFQSGTVTPNSGDNRAAAVVCRYGRTEFWGDNSTTAWSSGNTITSMQANMYVHAAGYVTKPNTVAFRAIHNGNQSLSSGDTITTWQTSNALRCHATGGASISSGVFTAPVTGVYVFHAQFLIMGASNTTGIHLIWKKNNSTFTYFNSRYHGNQLGYGGYVPICGQTTMHLDANENCRIVISFGGTSPSVYGTDGNWGFWDGYLLG